MPNVCLWAGFMDEQAEIWHSWKIWVLEGSVIKGGIAVCCTVDTEHKF